MIKNNNYGRKTRRLKVKNIKRWRFFLLCATLSILVIFLIALRYIKNHSEDKSIETSPVVQEMPKIIISPLIPADWVKPANQPVPESDPVTDSYFADAIFIGDSRTQALQFFSGLTETTYYADKGLNVKTIFDKKTVKSGDTKITIIEALKQTPFNKAYIMFGINELGWPSSTHFIDYYSKIIDELLLAQPNATIYVQSILPVTTEKSNSNTVFTNEKVNHYNELIFAMCKEKNVNYIDLNGFAQDEKGALFADASTDGIHLTKAYVIKWLDYLKTHTIK